MASPSFAILDVGHGNCAVLAHGGGIVIVDAGLGSTLLEFLEARGITVVDHVLISHADADHLAGVGQLLLHPDVKVGTVMVNPDAKTSKEWQDFRIAARDARLRRGTRVVAVLTTNESPVIDTDVRVEVLSPTPEVALGTSQGKDLDGRALSSNAMSAVIRISSQSGPEVLLAGDIDATGLKNLLDASKDPRARILVFPHHGGHAGTNDLIGFAQELCAAVKPEVVFFSIARGRFDTPQPDIVTGVRTAAPTAHIACTQLSERCATVIPAGGRAHESGLPAAGSTANNCCAGTTEFVLGSAMLQSDPKLANHLAFITSSVPTPLCINKNTEPAKTP